MTYEGAINFLDIARDRIYIKDIPGKSLYLNKASAIVSELLCSLDKKAGGEIASNLEKLYNYMLRQIANADLKNDHESIGVVILLLKELKAGWAEIGRQGIRETFNYHHHDAANRFEASIRI
ncbi:MAG: flagellar export chaperone FliS [Deltaproteobacteria bacterium]|nr:flagellar export chaperone FliS [Deltaproteobacteria bacterium]